MTQTANSDRVARHRARRDIERLGRMNGWTLIPDATVFVARNGTTVVVGIDGARIPLSIDPDFDDIGQPAETKATRTAKKKVYPPKLYSPEVWNSLVSKIRERGLTKAETLDNLSKVTAKSTDPDAPKMLRQVRAVLDALPDTPDWASSLPLADVAGDNDA